MADVVILGGGTAGTVMANRLRRVFGGARRGRTRITVVDRDPTHLYQPGFLLLPFGVYTPEQLQRPRTRQLHSDIHYVQSAVQSVDTGAHVVHLGDGSQLRYDVLIVATGTRVAPEETEGLTGAGWRERMFDFYTLRGATLLRDALRSWRGGRLVIDVVDMPIKCPVAPLEFAFLADWYFTMRGIRKDVEITYVTPLDGAFTKPVASAALSHLLAEKGIELVTEFSAGRVDGVAGTLHSWDEREVPFDLLVTIPLHVGADFVGRSPGLGDDMGFVRTDPNTLQSLVSPDVFAIGDATNVATSKAGSVAHFQAEVLEENIRRHLAGKSLEPGFDGHANCFVETGFDEALLIDFNYETEPLPGEFPLPVIGPMRLLEPTRLNHLGKLAFRWIYWNVLLPGRNIPGIGARMSMRGKRVATKISAGSPTSATTVTAR